MSASVFASVQHGKQIPPLIGHYLPYLVVITNTIVATCLCLRPSSTKCRLPESLPTNMNVDCGPPEAIVAEKEPVVIILVSYCHEGAML